MPNFGDKKVYVISAVIVLLVIMYFLINYQVKDTLHRELRKLSDRKKKKQKTLLMNQKRLMHTRDDENQNDMDSYQDPAERHNEDNENDEYYDKHERLSKNDMGMRDFVQ